MAERKPKPPAKPAPPVEEIAGSIEVACQPESETPVHIILGLGPRHVRSVLTVVQARRLNVAIGMAIMASVQAATPPKPKLILPN